MLSSFFVAASIAAFSVMGFGVFKKKMLFVFLGGVILFATSIALNVEGINEQTGYIKTECFEGDCNATAYDYNYMTYSVASNGMVNMAYQFYWWGGLALILLSGVWVMFGELFAYLGSRKEYY